MWSEVVYLHSENSCFSMTKMETIFDKTKKAGKFPRFQQFTSMIYF